jgi:hypothetical protein
MQNISLLFSNCNDNTVSKNGLGVGNSPTPIELRTTTITAAGVRCYHDSVLCNNLLHKDLSPNGLSEVERFGAAEIYTSKKFCECPSSQKGIINLDVSAHTSNCRFRKRLVSKRFTMDTSITPEDFKDGYQLGAAI